MPRSAEALTVLVSISPARLVSPRLASSSLSSPPRPSKPAPLPGLSTPWRNNGSCDIRSPLKDYDKVLSTESRRWVRPRLVVADDRPRRNKNGLEAKSKPHSKRGFASLGRQCILKQLKKSSPPLRRTIPTYTPLLYNPFINNLQETIS